MPMSDTNNPQSIDKKFFLAPQKPMQKRYEALRASFVDQLPDPEVAEKFGYTYFSFKSMKRDCKSWTIDQFFKELQKGTKGEKKKTTAAKDKIIELRKKNYSVIEIKEKLAKEGIELSETIIHKILSNEGFAKLFRRTKREQLEALQNDKNYPDIADQRRFAEHAQFSTSFAGIYLFLPIICQLKLHELFSESPFYGSKMISNINYLMSFLTLKLLGKERLSHVDDFNFDYGLGTFAGLNVLPKNAAITQYSYRHSAQLIRGLLKGFVKRLALEKYLKGQNINLDFHVIPHYGEESELEDSWVATKGKSMKSVLSFFAQDLDTTFLCFSDGEIRREDMNDEILEFVKFYKETVGIKPERLIFDSKLTTYGNLSSLNEEGILFITLKRRGKNFLKEVAGIKEWKKVKIDKMGRKYKNLLVSESKVKIKDYEGLVRKIIVTGNGRELPMCLLSNDMESSARDLLANYAKRWRIENNIQENVDFFNLNALSSPVVVKVNFDIAMTLIGNTLYKILAEKTKWFKNAKPKKIFRNFIEGKATVKISEDTVKIIFAKKSFNPLIMEWVHSLPELIIPWWNNRKLLFEFE